MSSVLIFVACHHVHAAIKLLDVVSYLLDAKIYCCSLTQTCFAAFTNCFVLMVDLMWLALMICNHVHTVDVRSNNLGVKGGKALADCLKSNTSITQVRFVYKCSRKQQKTHRSDYLCHLSCLQLSFCTLYTGRSIQLWDGLCRCQGLW